MSISNLLRNNRVELSFVEYSGYKFLVCVSVVGAHQIMMIEELQSGIRVFPNHSRIESSSDMERILFEEFNKIIEANFAT